MFCSKCGTDVPEGSKFCETCGNNMQLSAQQEEYQEQSAEGFSAAEPAAQPIQNPQPIYQPQAPAYQQPAYQAQPIYQRQPAPAPQPSTYNIQDPLDKPYSVGGWLLTFLVMLIPIVHIVMPFVWAFGSKTNRSKKNFFIAALIVAAIMLILTIVFAASLSAVINNLLEQMNGFGDMDTYFPY